MKSTRTFFDACLQLNCPKQLLSISRKVFRSPFSIFLSLILWSSRDMTRPRMPTPGRQRKGRKNLPSLACRLTFAHFNAINTSILSCVPAFRSFCRPNIESDLRSDVFSQTSKVIGRENIRCFPSCSPFLQSSDSPALPLCCSAENQQRPPNARTQPTQKGNCQPNTDRFKKFYYSHLSY